ncbi:MAG: tetratricopeptide repeat protein [Saprospiraceae bacterium]
MKPVLLIVFVLIVSPVSAQNADSLAVAQQVDSLIQISRDLTAKSDFEKALKVTAAAEKIALEKFGRESAAYGSCSFNQGRVYHFERNYPEAEKWYVDALAIREKALGKEHPDYAASLNNLAALYNSMGQYEKAEPLIIEAKAIREKTLGKEHPHYATSLNNLANLYYVMGQYEKAEPLFKEAKAIQEKVLGKEHLDYAASLNNLAALYNSMGQYEKAEPLFLEAKAIREKALGKKHPNYATSLNNLAFLYYEMGQYEKAEPLIIEAKAIREKALGKEHPEYASSLNNLANLYNGMGQYEKAEPLIIEAKAIHKKALGKEHPEYAGCLDNLAALYKNIGQYENAEPLYQELSAVNKHMIEKAMLHLSEQELNDYLSTLSYRQDRILSFTQSFVNTQLIPTCYDNSLFYKGFLLQAAGRIKQLALSDPTATENFNRLKGYQRRLAALYAKPIAERDSALVAQLETQANDFEKDLARTVAGYEQAKRQVSWPEVQSALKPGEAALEFVHYRYYNPNATDSTMYAALVLQAGNAEPTFIPLFEERSLDTLLTSSGVRRADYVNQLYTLTDRGVIPSGKLHKTLYDLLWKPLEPHLQGINTIYYSPSGLLHRLNLAAIPVNLDSVLADRYQLVELGSTRQLVVPSDAKPAANVAVLFGGIHYDADDTAISQANAGLDSVSMATRGELSFSYTDSTLRVGTWGPLPFTGREVSGVEKTLKAAGFQTSTSQGYAATEEAFKAIGRSLRDDKKGSPRILHIATHGFFFPDPKTSPANPLHTRENEPVFKMSDHPMIRSGLILAGGNHAWQTGKSLKPDMEDGILTAYEISQMNLSNTELVVLSACETGLGDIQGNEGVYGLQRAFKIAGAKYLIMSLWQVPDKETAYFMELFYKHLVDMDMDIPSAFRATQDELRANPFITPYQWAGFVLLE